jgi:hypothetical protein
MICSVNRSEITESSTVLSTGIGSPEITSIDRGFPLVIFPSTEFCHLGFTRNKSPFNIMD